MGNLKEIKVGDIKSSSGISSTVTDVDPTTGAISWDIDYVPNLDKLLNNSDELTDTAKGVYTKTKGDKKFLDIYEASRRLRNIIRTHIRNNYPEEYKKSRGVNEVNEGKNIKITLTGDKATEVDFFEKYSRFFDGPNVYDYLIIPHGEKYITCKPNKLKSCENYLKKNNIEYKIQESVVNEANLSHHMQIGDDWGEIIFYLEKYGTDEEIDAYITAFKEQTGPDFDDSDWDHIGEFQKWVKTAMRADEMSTSGGAGSYLTPYAFRLKGQKPNDKAYKELGYKEVKEGIGATLGLGPKASEDGVKDNAYVKQFAYKLVPKKIKGSGMIVKQLFEYNDFQEGRIRNFDVIEDKINSILPMISNAKNKTAEHYNENPGSYNINYPTDAILKELDDVIEQLKQANEDVSKSI